VHDTPDSWLCDAPDGFGVATIVQLVPFQRSTNVRLTLELVKPPTAKQLVALVHDTAVRSLDDAPDGFGLATTVQLVPFQRSTNVRPKPALKKRPTAKQFVVLVQDTATSWLSDAPAGFGLATSVQLVPFQRSTSVPSSELPTAKQFVVLVHDTPDSWLNDAPDGFGLATTVQLVPFHRSTNVV
jgi:hypothetical protein